MAISMDPAVGLVLPPAVPPDVLWPALALADGSGFDSVWVTDRTLVPGVAWLDSLTLLGAVVARTSTVRVGTSVLAIGRRNPVYTAHALATAQFLARGRLLAGVGLGGLEPAEYRLAGVPMQQRAALTDEYIDLLRRLWTEEAVDHAGEGYRCEGVDLLPKPETPIPVWVGGNSPPAYARAGQRGDGWLSVFCGPDQFEQGWSQVSKHALDAGRDPGAITRAAYVFAAIGRTEGTAESILEPALRGLFGASLDQLGFACLYGTPQRWVDTLGRFGAAGAENVNVLLFSQDLRADVELISTAVLPQLAQRRIATPESAVAPAAGARGAAHTPASPLAP